MPRTAKRIAWGIAAYTGFVASLVPLGCADRLLLHPSVGSIPLGRGAHAAIPFGDGTLDIVRVRLGSGPPRARVLVFTGNAGRAEREIEAAARLFEAHAVELIALNPPGFGASSGRATLGSLGPSGVALFDAIRAEDASTPLGVYGNSMGGVVALHVASRREVAGVVLRNPPPLRDLILGNYGWWNLWLIALPIALSVPSELDAIENAAAIRVPVVLLRADSDRTVPPEFQVRIEQAFQCPKTTIEYAGGHNEGLDGPTTARARAAIAEFLP